MAGRLTAALAALAAMALLHAGPLMAQGTVRTDAFARGINIGDYLAYPEGKSWPLFRGPEAEVTDGDLQRLSQTGLTFIRLPVEPGPFLDSPPGQVAQLEQRLLSLIRRAQGAGLAVLVTGFARHETPPWRPEDILQDQAKPAFRRYAGFLARLAELIAQAPEATTALELMNEPQPECGLQDVSDWTFFQRELHARLRAAAPDLTLVLTGGCWSGIDGLKHLDMTGYDANTMVDVHYYEPFSFTHQGATWTLPELKYLGALSFPAGNTDPKAVREAISRLAVARHPGDQRAQRLAYSAAARKLDAYLREDADAEAVARDMARVARWADRMGVAHGRIMIGEFGTLRPVPESKAQDDGSRARWLEAVAQAAKSEGFGWSLWAFKGTFRAFDLENPEAGDAARLKALGLKPPVKRGGIKPPPARARRKEASR